LPDIDAPIPHESQAELKVVALDLRRVTKPGSAILGSFSAWVPQHDARYYECLWGRKASGEEWILLPRRHWTDAAGNTHYQKLIDFGSDRSERAFARAALKAVRELNAKTPR
jgi:hypothetical protein